VIAGSDVFADAPSRDRPREGQRHQVATQAQFRHGDAGRLSQAQRLFDMAIVWIAVLSRWIRRSISRRRAEERGQSEAIARSTQAGLELRVPFICTIIGTACPAAALAIATANRVYMLEHSIYSVISPEGCASILWRNATRRRTRPPRSRSPAGSARSEDHRRDHPEPVAAPIARRRKL